MPIWSGRAGGRWELDEGRPSLELFVCCQGTCSPASPPIPEAQPQQPTAWAHAPLRHSVHCASRWWWS